MKKLLTGLMAIAMLTVFGVELSAVTVSAEVGVNTTNSARNEVGVQDANFGADIEFDQNAGAYVSFMGVCIDNNDPDGFRLQLAGAHGTLYNDEGIFGVDGHSIDYLLQFDTSSSINGGTLGSSTADTTTDLDLGAGDVVLTYSTVTQATNDGVNEVAAGNCDNGAAFPLNIKVSVEEVAQAFATDASIKYKDTITAQLGDI